MRRPTQPTPRDDTPWLIVLAWLALAAALALQPQGWPGATPDSSGVYEPLTADASAGN